MQRAADITEVAEQAVELQAEVARGVITESETVVEVVVDISRAVQQRVSGLWIHVPHVGFVGAVCGGREHARDGEREQLRTIRETMGIQHGGLSLAAQAGDE